MLWSDEEFYKEVSSIKRLNISKFPRCDQWCDDDGLHMAFALAGYGGKDIVIEATQDSITIYNNIQKEIDLENEENTSCEDDASKIFQQGIICRGIARRKFQKKFIINDFFNPYDARAEIRYGLLEIIIPKRKSSNVVKIAIGELDD